jgi:pyridoxal phosphate enzyme (YggS family)
MRDAHAAGQRHFGENYVQEAIDKREHLADLNMVWHFIGPIQSNKTRDIANAFDWVHSVDRDKIAERLSAQRDPALPALNVCVQVNLSDEDSKSGVALADAAQLCALVARLPNLALRGLMAIPAALDSEAEQRACFAPLRQEFDRLRETLPTLDTLSIGMSGDYGAAIAEGSTMVRIGTALFGARPS